MIQYADAFGYCNATRTSSKNNKAIAIRFASEKASANVYFSSGNAIIFSDIFRYKNEVDNGDGRILLINVGSDLRGEHNILMNIFFAAHKHSILIDVANTGWYFLLF